MSLINQMLKDLARREKTSIGAELALPELPVSPHHTKKIRKKYFLLVALLLFLGLLFFAATYQHFHLKYISFKKQNTLILNAPPPSLLTGITFQMQNEMTFLRLLLSRNTLYHVINDVKQQKVMLILQHAKFVAGLPSIDYVNSAIKNIQVTTENNNLKIVLTLNAGVDLKRVALNQSNKLPELQFDFARKNLPNTVEVNQKVEPVKKVVLDLSLENAYQKALRFSARGQMNQAVDLLSDILMRSSDFSPARVSLATLLLENGQKERASAVIKIGLQQRPSYPPYAQLKARIFVSEGRVAEAIHLLQAAAPPLAKNPDYHAFLAALYQRQGQFTLSAHLYEQLLTMQPNKADWWVGLGIAFENMGQHERALKAYARADNTDNLSPELKTFAEDQLYSERL